MIYARNVVSKIRKKCFGADNFQLWTYSGRYFYFLCDPRKKTKGSHEKRPEPRWKPCSEKPDETYFKAILYNSNAIQLTLRTNLPEVSLQYVTKFKIYVS